MSYVPIVSVKLPFDDSGISFTRKDRNKMYLGGTLGLIGGAGSLLGLAYLVDPLLEGNDVAIGVVAITALLVLPPLGTAAGIHISQMNSTHTARFSCTLGGALGGYVVGLRFYGVGALVMPTYYGAKDYQRCAYLKDGIDEDSSTVPTTNQ
jgi:hypothetical protein